MFLNKEKKTPMRIYQGHKIIRENIHNKAIPGSTSEDVLVREADSINKVKKITLNHMDGEKKLTSVILR